uniref:Uncharacterized protein n=1 Tax=Ciona savignyi TaxID=51511 RepID=H2YDC8_CIOSA
MAESNYCDKLMQNDLVNLWKLTKSLRSMLVECQKLIHAEASKIELECLDKIKDLEAERVENRSQLLQATEEIKQLKQSNEEFCKEIAIHKSQSSHQDEVCKDLAKQLMEAETKLESYQSRNLNLEEEMKSQVCDNLSLLARVGELEGHTVALSQHMEGKRDERNIL